MADKFYMEISLNEYILSLTEVLIHQQCHLEVLDTLQFELFGTGKMYSELGKRLHELFLIKWTSQLKTSCDYLELRKFDDKY